MDIKAFQIMITTFISIFSALLTALGVFYKLKIEQAVSNTKITELEKDNILLHERITAFKADFNKEKDQLIREMKELHKELSDMRVEILEKINNLKP